MSRNDIAFRNARKVRAMISVVCVYNNKSVLDMCLLPGLEKQSAGHELILLDNTERRYRSAADALNDGGKRAKGKYVMFIHQDVAIGSPVWLDEVERTLDSLPNLGAAGVAGVRDRRGVISNITHCDPPKPGGDVRIDVPEKVQTLDECVIVIPSQVFGELKFDGRTCDNWHLYGVDLCLTLGERGLDVYVIPGAAHHMTFSTGSTKSIFKIFSPGAWPADYYRSLKKILRKHRKHYRRVYTTCGIWNTSYPVSLQRAYFILYAYALFYKKRLFP